VQKKRASKHDGALPTSVSPDPAGFILKMKSMR